LWPLGIRKPDIPRTLRGRVYSRNHKFNEQSIYFLVARDAPVAVKHALQLLCYSGVVLEGPSGMRSKKVVGTRFIVNIGCQLALDDDPIGYCKQIVSSLATRMSIEYPSDSHGRFKIVDHVVRPRIANGRCMLRVAQRVASAMSVRPYRR